MLIQNGQSSGALVVMLPQLSSIQIMKQHEHPLTIQHGMAPFDSSGLTTYRRKSEDGVGNLQNVWRHMVLLLFATCDDHSILDGQGDDDNLSVGYIDYPDTMMIYESSLASLRGLFVPLTVKFSLTARSILYVIAPELGILSWIVGKSEDVCRRLAKTFCNTWPFFICNGR